MYRIYLMVVVIAACCATIMFNACFSSETEPEPFTIVWNFDTSGYLETCGCSAHQLGGLARRATKIHQLRERQPLLAIEGAHILEEPGEFPLFKAEIIVKCLNALDYSAMQLGVREAQNGIDGLSKLVEIADFPCFSANLQTADGLWGEPFVIATVGGVDVGITGVSQPELIDFELPDDLCFASPSTGLDLAIAGIKKKNVDIIVVCLEGNDFWIGEMQQCFSKQADLFLSGDRKETTAHLEFHNNPPSLNNWKLGKYLGLVTVDPALDGFSFAGMTIKLEEDIEDDAEIIDILDNDFRAQLKPIFFSQMKVDLEQLYLPPVTCEPCHKDEYESYMASGHSNALETLEEKGQMYNPECMSCHLVYDPDLDELQSINCVVCHSNITDQHIWDALDDKVVAPDPPVTSYTFDFCVSCHDEINSLPFESNWPQYMFRVFHGGDISSATEAAEAMGLDVRSHEPQD